MAKEKDINNGFKIGDIVKHKSGVQGRINQFEWSGIRRAAVENEAANGYYIISVEELELVSRPEKEEIKDEEGSKEGHSKKD